MEGTEGEKIPLENSYSIKKKPCEELLDDSDLSHCNIFNSNLVLDLDGVVLPPPKPVQFALFQFKSAFIMSSLSYYIMCMLLFVFYDSLEKKNLCLQ